MKSDLDLVIKVLEAEKKSIEKQIKKCLSENDYLISYYHSEALNQLNSRLTVLYQFKDPLYNERQNLKRLESFYKKKPDFVSDSKMWNRIKENKKEKIKKQKSEFEEKVKNINTFFNDSQEIDDALFNLYEGKYKGFKLLLDQLDEFELVFTINSNRLRISTKPYWDMNEPDFILDNRIPNPIEGLGFKFDPISYKAVYEYDMNNFKDAWPIKLLLSRLFFDVYQFYDINQSAKLVYQ